MTSPTRIGALQLTSETKTDGLFLVLAGEADMRDGAELAKHLLGTHRSAMADSAQRVMVDVTDVEFMNSTALSAFVGWVAELQKLEVAKRYRIHFKGSGTRRWQRGSLHALASFAPELISVDLA